MTQKEQAELNNALARSALNNNIENMKSLIKRGANPNAQSELFQKNTALTLATGANKLEAVELLLNEGADVNIKNGSGSTALHIALIGNSYNNGMVEALIKAGADLNARNIEEQTPLDIAKRNPIHYNKLQEIIAKQDKNIDKSWTSTMESDVDHQIKKTKNTLDSELLSLLGDFNNLKERLDRDYNILKRSIEQADISNCSHVAIRSIPKEYYNTSAPPKGNIQGDQSLRAGFEYVRNSVKSRDGYPAIAFSINPSKTPLLKTYAYQATDDKILGKKHQRDAVIIVPLPDKESISLLDKWKSLKQYVKENKSLKERENILQLISDKIDGLTYISAAYAQDAYSDYTNKEGKIKISSDDAKVDVSSLFTNESKDGHSEVFIKLRQTHPTIYLVKLDVPQQDRDRLSGMFAGSFTINSSFKDLQILEAIPSSSKAYVKFNPFTAQLTEARRNTSPEGRSR